ncbi:MAG: tRNA (guanosine(37)-N1)-methyltransferase TrmD [Oscillospiraceae bacterium]|nr:tRNA (guanosine(37)-N1)-methyltransferase TrmD [Oscillospiraceae bacterium]
MRIEIASLFPQMCESVLNTSIIGRARKSGAIQINCHDIRDYSQNKHKRTDDAPFGGGMGMLMTPEPVYRCITAIKNTFDFSPKVIYMTPAGTPLVQEKVVRLAEEPGFIILCGHYEGIDQRVIDVVADEEISIGDYILTGGELPALILADAVARLCPGTLPNEECFTEESHYSGSLEYAQYTRPYEWMGIKVPEVLVSGNHAMIKNWREEDSRKRTQERRPDLIKSSK